MSQDVATRKRKFRILQLKEYLRIQTACVFSDLNKWAAGEHFGHNPSGEECWKYWLYCGGRDRFALEHWDRLIAGGIIAEEVQREKIGEPAGLVA